MKKFKLFALAVMAMLSTNAFAADFESDGESATKLFTFEYDNDLKQARIIGFVSELDDEFKAAVAIPATVTHPTSVDPATEKLYVYDVVGINKDAFKNQPVTSISFFEPAEGKTGITVIGEGAFAGTGIQTLDLSNTRITTVNNLFGTTVLAVNSVQNKTLKSVTLPATWKTISEAAFASCITLETINFGTAAEAVDAQTIGTKAFAGCSLKALNFTGTKVKAIPAALLYDGQYTNNTSLQTLTLTDKFEASANGLNGSFANCTALTTVANLEKTAIVALKANEFKGDAALTTINTEKITTFNESCFDGCAALAEVKFNAATTIGTRAFAGTALTAVTFPAEGLKAIGEQAFFECGSLETVKFDVTAAPASTSDVNSIGTQAFAYTAITAITIPEKTANLNIAAKAFAGTPITSFTWKAMAYSGDFDGEEGQLISTDIFNKCSNVAFNTTDAFITAWIAKHDGATVANPLPPTNSKFTTAAADKPFEPQAYSTNPNKFYVKWFGEGNIKVKKSEAKVYSGFLEGDKSLGLIQHKADANGYVQIAAGEAVLIITDNSELTYLPGDGESTSWTGLSDVYTASEELADGKKNYLKYCTEATTRGTLESHLTDDTFYIYGWMKAGGFQKITSGTAIPKGTLFAFAKEPVAGGRMTIKWYDENGNLEDETTAIDAIVNKAAEAEGESYNLAGQKVSKSYKGFVIKDGKKYIQK